MATRQINNGVDVPAAGTAVPLSATRIAAVWVFLQAKVANTGKIYVGTSDVSSTSFGVELSSLDGYAIPPTSALNIYDLSDIYIDAGVSGDGVTVHYAVH